MPACSIAFPVLALSFLLSGPAAAEDPSAGKDPLATLRSGHPRLILTDNGLRDLKALIARDEGARKLRDGLRAAGEKLLAAPTVEHKLIGPRLLDQSRRCLRRVYTLALLYRLDGDARWRDRAVKELSAAAAFPDWNPSHFLDTAEMSHAFAIGYDWLFGALTPEERATVRGALVEKGLKASLEFYKKKSWWVAVRHNWNQVCNGGIGLGALAVADEERELASYIVEHALASVRLPLAEYGPDGAWSEGPGYWEYATSYTVYLLAGLLSALGTDGGLADTPGFAEAGLFRIHSTGPTGLAFNFADADAHAGSSPEMFWLARRFHRPVYAWWERSRMRGADPHDLLWYDAEGKDPAAEGFPPSAYFRGAEVAFLRTGWGQGDLFAGFKGGDNKANHSHLDLGTFVLDARGERWAHDLGADEYNLPDYFGKKRWTYYRLRSEGHNIVTLDGKDQDPRARAPITAFSGDPKAPFAVADLAAAYPDWLKSHRRGLALFAGRHLLVVDEVETEKDETLLWTLHTAKEPRIEGARAEVARGEERLEIRVLEPADARLEALPAAGPPPQAQAPDLARLVFKVQAKAGVRMRIAVALTPHRAADQPPEVLAGAASKPLADWGK